MDYTTRLPAELVASIMDHLANLFVVAAVCSRWREIAVEHPQYYLEAKLELHRTRYPRAPPILDVMAQWVHKIEHAKAYRRRLEVTIAISLTDIYIGMGTEELVDSIAAHVRPVLGQIVRLSIITTSDVFRLAPIANILSSQAQHLRSLSLRTTPTSSESSSSPRLPIRGTLFSTIAPTLTHVSLCGIALPSMTCSAFTSTTDVSVTRYNMSELPAICHAFPRMAALAIAELTIDQPPGGHDPRETLPSSTLRRMSIVADSEHPLPPEFVQVFQRRAAFDDIRVEWTSSSVVLDTLASSGAAARPGLLPIALEVIISPPNIPPERWWFQPLTPIWPNVVRLDIPWQDFRFVTQSVPDLRCLREFGVNLEGFALQDHSTFSLTTHHHDSSSPRLLHMLVLYDRLSEATVFSTHVVNLSRLLDVECWDVVRLKGVRFNSPYSRTRLARICRSVEEDA
ncbi:hypothetical protein EXIGLDRAFT_716494 [Exidia glandulosa HHB12029]|uniref:Uncharacterized protein n=1 Tax=Exidia glandulosa HHB12029 TaxID=1314781 RepID=A0A165P9M5_EXIGL|nr:hypothetical protein EXIGLDRAFT_716494 [Exidia glandulosa HHB12029]